ncbi:hypothetical protein [Undibacterium terreum]|uniref:Uncharacterized protein n=1 Tax=Undibacterium terreum TaxID=1224302 RepID=A0A916XJU0_9BURK|nr:hypothetical protein [Undibacterium terreum]GGC77324.1 hypothetical protein GCM10011396_25590 [Undibacterium terreum]
MNSEDYKFSIVRQLDAAELESLRADNLPNLLTLNARYSPHIDVENAFPITPIYIDFLRTQWRLDREFGRAEEDVAISGLGFGFGILLGACTQLKWCIASDAIGNFLTMARTKPAAVSVPPFTYVAKRQDIENAEVFRHFFEQVSADWLGFERPSNWLLDQ